MTRLYRILPLLLTAFVLYGCSRHWTEAIKSGRIDNPSFNTSVDINMANELVIVPVTINNKSYQFLFDTGAPFSISKELQNEFNFKRVSKGKLRDSDNSRISVDYVSIPKLFLKDIAFRNQVAFVGDFDKNPIIKCLQIDGIIGSNMMRFCNWKIDVKHKKIHISNDEFMLTNHDSIRMKFNPNKQYSIKVNAHLGKSKISNITLDYGSNGGLTVPIKIYDTLVNRKIIKKSLLEYGVHSSGLGGQLKTMNRKFSRVDSLALGAVISNYVPIKTGKSGLLGTEVLSNYIVAINWTSHSLAFEKYPEEILETYKTFGLKIGKKNNMHFVSAVVKDSPAEKAGIKPKMEVINYNHIEFLSDNYCDYINYLDSEKPDKLHLTIINDQGKKQSFELLKSQMF